MSENAIALLVLAAFAVIIPLFLLLLSYVAGRPRRVVTDLTPYEGGMRPFESARRRFSIRFYIVAMLFILFDVEAAFFYPWAVKLKAVAAHSPSGPGFVFGTMAVFFIILVVGYLYALGRGALDWDR